MTKAQLPKFEASCRHQLDKLAGLPGFLGAALLNTEQSLILHSCHGEKHGEKLGDNPRLASSCSKLVRDKAAALRDLGVHDYIEDVLITLGRQYHFVRPFRRHDKFALYLTIDRAHSNVNQARIALSEAVFVADQGEV